jgi:putative ATP-binding cassette transporter
MALVLARVVLHAPRWVVFDDTFSSMEDETLRRAVYLFTQQATRTTVILIGRSTQAHLPLFSRVLHLSKVESGMPEGAQRQRHGHSGGSG